MNRRHFVAMLAALPIATLHGRAEKQQVAEEYWARRNFEPIDPHNPVLGIHAMLLKFSDVATAEIAIGQFQTDGHLYEEGRTAEDYTPVEILPSPEMIALPSALRRFVSVAPPSSGLDEIPYLDLFVQREDVLVNLMVRGSDESLVMETLVSLMLVMLDYDQSNEEPVKDETGRRTGGTWDLMLQKADLPEGFQLYQEADDNETVSFRDCEYWGTCGVAN